MDEWMDGLCSSLVMQETVGACFLSLAIINTPVHKICVYILCVS